MMIKKALTLAPAGDSVTSIKRFSPLMAIQKYTKVFCASRATAIKTIVNAND